MTRARVFVVALVLFAVTCTATALVILANSSGLTVPDSWGFRGFATIFAVAFTWVGGALTWRRPLNAIGWILLAVGILSALQAVLSEYAIFGVIGRSSALPGAVFAAWVVAWIWVSEVTLVAVFLPLLFPDGHFLSRRWHPVGWLGAVTATAMAGTTAFSEGPLNNAPYADNPYGLLSVSLNDSVLPVIGIALLGLAAAAAAASLFVRYHRSHGAERQQLKWLAFEVIFLSVAVFVGSLNQEAKWPSVLLIGAIALAPVMVGLAVLRYRVQRTVDRRFYRSRYDAARTLDAFSVRLRDEVDLDAVRGELVAAVRDTVQPAHASLWLRGGRP